MNTKVLDNINIIQIIHTKLYFKRSCLNALPVHITADLFTFRHRPSASQLALHLSTINCKVVNDKDSNAKSSAYMMQPI